MEEIRERDLESCMRQLKEKLLQQLILNPNGIVSGHITIPTRDGGIAGAKIDAGGVSDVQLRGARKGNIDNPSRKR